LCITTTVTLPPTDSKAWQTAGVVWVLDLDGVVWLAGHPIDGSADAIKRLRAAGQRPVFVTNNSGPTVADYMKMLGAVGIELTPADLVSSAQAAASLLTPGSRAAVIGGPGVTEALEQRGVKVVAADDSADAVVVGRTTDLSYDALAAAATAIRQGARFVATNTDATLPTPDGPVPGAGAIVAFLQVSSGVAPVVAGKPHQPVADLIIDLFGPVTVAVGDRLDTDGALARALGARFALVLTGVTKRSDLPATPAPDVVADDLAGAVGQLIGDGGGGGGDGDGPGQGQRGDGGGT
jgi:HAD superfamily hydrolase (TIGR01450 family)